MNKVLILGAGMVNPRVLEMVGYDHNKYSGFAFGMGVAVDFIAIVTLIMLETIVSKIRGVNIVYG